MYLFSFSLIPRNKEICITVSSQKACLLFISFIIQCDNCNIFSHEFILACDLRQTLLVGHSSRIWWFLKHPWVCKNRLIWHYERPIWVHFHNILITFMQSNIQCNIDSKIGKVLEIEAGDDRNCSHSYARIKVMLDITQPL